VLLGELWRGVEGTVQRNLMFPGRLGAAGGSGGRSLIAQASSRNASDFLQRPARSDGASTGFGLGVLLFSLALGFDGASRG
jgi:hypothetical protein